MKDEILFLGAGGSTGVPIIGNDWGACDPNEPKNRRTRCSAAVFSGETTIIIDTGPDFREQINREKITDITAVMYTHAHGDHVNGIDDLRPFAHRIQAKRPIYAEKEVLDNLTERFDHLFVQKRAIYPDVLDPIEIKFGQRFTIQDVDVIPFEQDHGKTRSTGFRIKDMAYSTDMRDLPEESLQIIEGVKTWVVDATAYKYKSSPVHANLEDVYALNERVKAETVYITHLPAHMDYHTLCAELPDGYKPAYDGLKIPF